MFTLPHRRQFSAPIVAAIRFGFPSAATRRTEELPMPRVFQRIVNAGENQLVLDIKLVVKTPGSYQRNVRRPCTKEVDTSRGRSLAGGAFPALDQPPQQRLGS